MSLKISTIIVDDEANSRENLALLLREFCPAIELVGMASNIKEAAYLLEKAKPQLAFLDIQLGSKTVFSLLSRLERKDFEIIFISAHEKFALRAFRFMAVDYLVKPIKIPELVKSVNNAIPRIEEKQQQHLPMDEIMLHLRNFNRDKHKIALATDKGYQMVYIHDIMYCLADGSYTHFVFKGRGEIVVSKNLKFYENLLSEYGFVRTHNTSLINPQYVELFDRRAGGSLLMEDGKNLPISKMKRQELVARIKDKRRLV